MTRHLLLTSYAYVLASAVFLTQKIGTPPQPEAFQASALVFCVEGLESRI